jgi:hypothetical protein
MALTRPLLSQLNTNIIAFSDNMMVMNAANVANRDIGTVYDRSVGGGANVAMIWQESRNAFTFAYTSSSGLTNANLTLTSNANIVAGNVFSGTSTVTGNITAGNVNATGVVRATGDMFGKELWSTQSSGDEGGQLNLGLPATNTTLNGNIVVDVYQNRLRFFEGGGTARGAYIDLTQAGAGVSTNLLAGGGGGTPGGANTYVQFNDGGLFGGNVNFTYDKGLNTVSAGAFAGTTNGTGQNFKVGDDAWIGDINVANAIGIRGQQDATQGYIVFGNSNSQTLGRSGTGALAYQGAFTAQGGLQSTPIGNASASTGAFTTISVTGITNSGANGTGNIGASGAAFNTIFAKATSAQYADLAEIYISDEDYPPGTVVVFGGEKEITTTIVAYDTRVAGVISTNPAYLMNSEVHGLPVALTGRVPCLVQGPVKKGDVLVTSTTPGAAQKINAGEFQPGCVIGKSLENIPDDELKLIEVVVGRF